MKKRGLKKNLKGCSTNARSKTRDNSPQMVKKTKIYEKKLSDPEETEMAARCSSRKKSVPEKLRNYVTEQDKEYLIIEELIKLLFRESC